MRHIGRRLSAVFVLVISASLPVIAQNAPNDKLSFEVATIKPTPPDDRSGRFTRMQSSRQFEAKSYSLKYMIAASYGLPLNAISGGPDWADRDLYDIRALTPGEAQPSLDQQMTMLRNLLADRFKLAFHRESKELPIYALSVADGGVRFMETAAPATSQPVLVNSVFPDHVRLPARNATMSQFAAMLQRAVLDRPVVDRTGLSQRYDFDLEWTADETQFGGRMPPPPPDAPRKPDLYAAMRDQLGLRLESTRGPIQTFVIDSVQRPTEN